MAMSEEGHNKEPSEMEKKKAKSLMYRILAVCLVLTCICGGGINMAGSIMGERISNRDPAWSPDGNQIAFSSSSSHSLERIYVMDADGSNLRRVTDDDERGREPTWSPDGARIAFVSKDRICVTDVTGGQVDCLTDSTMDVSYPAWSPVGDEIAFIVLDDTATSIYAVDIDGSNLRHVVDISHGFDYTWPPAWSPDGSMIAYYRGGYGEDSGIYVVDSDGSNLRHLDGSGVRPTWSQDGTEVVFWGADAIYGVSVDEGNVRRVADTPELDRFSTMWGLVWSPDRGRLAIVAEEGRDKHIYVMSADGSECYRLTRYTIWDRLFPQRRGAN
jgi:Tol biopolymer transport system component